MFHLKIIFASLVTSKSKSKECISFDLLLSCLNLDFYSHLVRHANPGVCVVEGAVEHASIAGRLLGTEQALEAGVLLSNLVAGAEKKIVW